jgi:signal peptidase II
MILAGAIGNIIDSMFYGLIFGESNYFEAAKLFPQGAGYEKFLHGRVVDMLYFPIIEGNYPDWFPFKGGEKFIFFRPIFNVADSAISVGVVCIFLFQRKYLREMQ